MTLKDCYRISLHTIKENRYRSILTVIISTFLSFLIMGMMSLAISFSKNGNEVIAQAYFDENSVVSVTYSNSQILRAGQQGLFKEKHYENFSKTVEDHKDVVDYVLYYPNVVNWFTFTDPNYPVYGGINIIEGRNIQKSEARNEAIVSKKYADDHGVKIGSTYQNTSSMSYISESGSRMRENVDLEYTVVGIYDYVEDTTVLFNGTEQSFSYNYIIADIGVCFNLENNYFYISSTELCHYNQTKDKSAIRTINRLKDLRNETSRLLPQSVTLKMDMLGFVSEVYHDGASCGVCDVYDQNQLLRLIISLSAIGFSILLSLMSVGSLANSVMISIDSSKKFIGLLKALGMKGKSLKLVVILESITLITVGVLLGYLLLFILNNPMTAIIRAIMNSAYGEYVAMIGFNSVIYWPFYIFAGTLVLFLLLTFIFSRGSLHKIAKMEPIAVINEVS